MRRITIFIFALLILTGAVFGQTSETFDIVRFSTPKGWTKQAGTDAVIFGAEDTAKNTQCLLTIFRSQAAGNDSRANFNAGWSALVQQLVKVSKPPQMQPTAQMNGWTAETGVSGYDQDGRNGLVMLITMTGGGKVVNVVAFTNSDAYFPEIAAFTESIVLPKIKAAATTTLPSAVTAPAQTAKRSGFTFNTTNFDDGWTAIEQEDWVRVSKGGFNVLLHYPNKAADAYNSVLRDETLTAWNLLVAPRYTNLRNFELKPIQSWESIGFAEGDVTDNATGKNVHVVLFKKHYSKGNGRYIEFITDSKASFEREFGAYHNNEFGWEKLADMQFRNKFDVAAADVVGKWSTSDYASISYFYVGSGGLAGTDSTATADEFTFLNGGNYQSQHSGASGMVGSMKFSSQTYKGKYSAGKWIMTLTNRFQGATEQYNAQFEAIKGGRILVMTDRNNTTHWLVRQ